jgi:hypothetical protein
MIKIMQELKLKGYKAVDKSKFPNCCIVCVNVDMENYWEFVCKDRGELPYVDFNGLCENFKRDES